jgi:DNA-binding response OmpR family regulator
MTTAKTILLVEDEVPSAEMLATFLQMNGYAVLVAHDGDTALEMLSREQTSVDLAILDIMVPGADGRQICTYIRGNPRIKDMPVIFLTAKDQEHDEILGLSIGADDYIPKPAGLHLILAHVRSLLRRRVDAEADSGAGIGRVLTVAELELDAVAMTVRWANRNIDLTAREFALLEMLVRQPRRVFSRQEILEQISRDEPNIFDRTVDVHVKNLRLKLGDGGGVIRTYRGHGYGIDRDLL